MPGGRVERRLSAVLAADVAGYSRLMAANETGTLSALKAIQREIVDTATAEHGGRIVKTTGDGMLVEFASVVDAVTCAMVVQSKIAERNTIAELKITFRIGINVGDIIVDGDDIFGDGVNIAARVEGECEPGRVYLTGAAFDQVRGKTEFAFEDLGEKSLKNIDPPVRLYAVSELGRAIASSPRNATLPVPQKPSVAVLPFQNMSGDMQQDYFADGIVEDMTTELSRFNELFVISRNSSFTYKGKSLDVRQIGVELGVRYILEGSVRRHADRVRITGQLVDAASGVHLWADRFEGELADVFELQDRVTTAVVGAIAPKIEQAEIERARRKNTDSLDAYDCYLRGRSCFHEYTERGIADALEFFTVAVRADPLFAAGYGMAAMCYALRRINGWANNPEHEAAKAAELVSRAIQLGKDDAVALSSAGYARARIFGDLDGAMPVLEEARKLNPNMAQAWYAAGYIKIFFGDAEVGLTHMDHAMRLSPLDPLMFLMRSGVGFAYFIIGDYKQAATWAERALREKPDYSPALRVAAASHALAGRADRATAVMTHMLALNPDLRLSQLKELVPFRRPEDYARYEAGLRAAGLPD